MTPQDQQDYGLRRVTHVKVDVVLVVLPPLVVDLPDAAGVAELQGAVELPSQRALHQRLQGTEQKFQQLPSEIGAQTLL